MAENEGASTRPTLRTAFWRSGDCAFSGYAVDLEDVLRRFTIEIAIDGYVLQTVRADAFVQELASEGLYDGCYGFEFNLPQAAIDDGLLVGAQLANLGTRVGNLITLDRATAGKGGINTDAVQWLGGLRFAGVVSSMEPNPPLLDVLVDEQLVMRLVAAKWSIAEERAIAARLVRTFSIRLPERFADGSVHRLTIVNPAGRALGDSPVTFVAFADGLEQAIEAVNASDPDRLRAALFDRYLPRSVPHSHYQDLIGSLPAYTAEQDCSGAVVVVGSRGFKLTLTSLEQQTHCQWIAASVPVREGPTTFHPNFVLEFLRGDAVGCQFVLFVLAGTIFPATTMARLADVFGTFKQADLVYGDLELIADDGAPWLLALSAFDYERMLEQGPPGCVFVLRKGKAEELLQQNFGELFRLFNGVFDEIGVLPDRVIHLPGPLASARAVDLMKTTDALTQATEDHLSRRGVAADVQPGTISLLPAVRVKRKCLDRSTTIIIPTRDRVNLLRACIDSIQGGIKNRRVEILIVDNDSTDPQTLAYLSSLEGKGISVLRIPGSFNFSYLNNKAVDAAAGELICLMNNDVEALDDEWFDELASRITDFDVGAVGAMLVRPDGWIQHAGIVLGPGFVAGGSFAAAHAFTDRTANDPGYGDLLRVAHECSAVTAACLLIRRADYINVGGMDEIRFPVDYNDVDLCLKLRALGKRIVLTPHARLRHTESASRSVEQAIDSPARLARQLQNLRNKWADVLLNDPYYSPLLSLDPIPYSGLAWPLRALTPRYNSPPLASDIPFGF